MSAILTDPAIARQRLIDLCAPTVDPVLDTSMAAAVKATGRITVVSQPAANDTLTVGGKTYTFVTGSPTGDQIQSVASLNTTAANILTKINADTATTLCTATRNNAVLTLLANTAGIAGNSIDLESSAAHVTVVAFSGGAAAITEDDISKILDKSVIATIWVASTEYEFGAVVIPTSTKRTGHRYQLVRFDSNGISSAATEPSWPTWDNATVTDGNLTWQEIGPEPPALWDLDRRAPYLAWQKKIDLVSCQYDFKSGDSADSMSQRIATLERQRDRYTPIFVL